MKWLMPISVITIVGCSSGGSSSTNNNSGGNNGDAGALQIIAPKIIYSKTAAVSSGYITVINPTATAVKNLHYNLVNPIGSGNNAALDQASAANCSEIGAHQQCNIKLNIAAGSVAGSLAITANNDSSTLAKLFKSSQSASTATLPVGIEQAYYNSIAGADGITVSYYHTVIAGVPYILVSGIVASDKAGSFNNIVLVDGNGNILPNQQLISGNVSSAQGSTFSVLLPVSPASGSSQTIKVQTRQIATDGSATVVSTATAGNTLNTTSGVGIADMLPGAVYLTAANPEQIITLVNNGDATAQLQSFAASNPNIEVVFNPTSLASTGTTTATLKLKNSASSATSGSATLSYNNGEEEVKTAAVVEQNISPQPNPNPSPSPSPTSAPIPPAPTAGLTAVLSPNDNFDTTTAIGTVSRQLTLTNSGNTTENNFVLTLPANFTISAGISNSCTILQGTSPATIGNSLTTNGSSCDVTVTYTNTTATSQAIANISIAYDYNSGTAAPNPITAAVNYRVTQSTANLTLTPNPVTFANVLNNNVGYNQQTVTVTNSGDETATNLGFSISGTDNTLFSTIAGGTCTSLLSSSNSCTITTQFGTVASSVLPGSKTANLDVSYTPYTNGGTQTVSSVLNGQVVAAQGANIGISNGAAVGFAGGDGSPGNPYQIEQNAAAGIISITYSNTGSVPATDFYIGGSATGWIVGDGCGTVANKITLAAINGSCTVTFTMSSTATTGADNLEISGLTLYWNDQANPNGQTQQQSGEANVNVYTPASIAITTNPVGSISVAPGGSFTVTATLTGGYNVPAQTIQATTTNSDITFSNSGTCQVSSASNTCDIIATASGTAATASAQTVTLSNTTTPNTAPAPATITFAIAPATPKLHIFVTSTTYNGDLKTAGGGTDGFDGANKLCATRAAAGSVTSTLAANWKALLYGNVATNNGTTYYDTSASENVIATADGGNLVGRTNILTPIQYNENGISISTGYVWTNGNGTFDCGGWTSSLLEDYGDNGYLNSQTSTWFYSGRQACNNLARLYCVQQVGG